MRWEGNRESSNVEDVRDSGGGGGGFGFGGRSIGIGTIVIALVGGAIFGINPLTILGMLSGGGPAPVQQQAPAHAPPANDQGAKFVSVVLADTEDVWGQIFSAGGATYHPPKLVLYRGATTTGCGTGQSAMGPFYCPVDQKVYIDLSFYDTLRTRLGAPGEFAQAYVIAHEVGHHVQNLLGTMDKVQAQMQGGDERTANALSVRLELQADCYAGVWGFYAQKRNMIDASDVDSGLRAAAAVGDDRIQKRTQGYVVPDSFTHGSAEQRTRWFRTGLASGDLRDCNTFAAR
jgi:uncharacterized protein